MVPCLLILKTKLLEISYQTFLQSKSEKLPAISCIISLFCISTALAVKASRWGSANHQSSFIQSWRPSVLMYCIKKPLKREGNGFFMGFYDFSLLAFWLIFSPDDCLERSCISVYWRSCWLDWRHSSSSPVFLGEKFSPIFCSKNMVSFPPPWPGLRSSSTLYLLVGGQCGQCGPVVWWLTTSYLCYLGLWISAFFLLASQNVSLLVVSGRGFVYFLQGAPHPSFSI